MNTSISTSLSSSTVTSTVSMIPAFLYTVIAREHTAIPVRRVRSLTPRDLEHYSPVKYQNKSRTFQKCPPRHIRSNINRRINQMSR